MPNIRNMNPVDEVIQSVIMGTSGSGKTWLAGTFPRPNFIDFDGKIGVLRNPDFVKKYGLKDVYYDHFSDTKRQRGFAIEATALDLACNYFDEWMKPKGSWKGEPTGREMFDTWVIDSGTALSEVCRNKALIVTSGAKRSSTFDKAKTVGIPVMEQSDFGAERSLVEQFVRMVKQSGKNVLLLVHEYEQTNDKGIVTAVKPLFTGGSKEVIASMFKDVWGLKVRGVGSSLRRVLLSDYDGISAARSEIGIGNIDHPDYNAIISRIRERNALAIQSGLTLAGESQPAKVAAKL